MKRRTFLQATLVAAPVIPAAASGRLHGTPGSIDAAGDQALRFKLPLSRSGVPPEFWRRLDAVAGTVQDAVVSASNVRALSADPVAYLRDRGMDISDITLADESVRIAVALSDPRVKASVSSGDYFRLLRYLESSGVLIPRSASNLQRRLEHVLSQNAQLIRGLLLERGTQGSSEREAMSALLNDGAYEVTVDDLVAVQSLLVREGEIPTKMVVAISIVAAVVTAVAAVMIAVIVAIPVVAYSTQPMGGIGRLDPPLMENHHRIARIGHILGDDRIAAHSLQEVIRAEAVAIVDAMIAVRLVLIPPSRREEAIEALVSYSSKVAMP